MKAVRWGLWWEVFLEKVSFEIILLKQCVIETLLQTTILGSRIYILSIDITVTTLNDLQVHFSNLMRPSLNSHIPEIIVRISKMHLSTKKKSHGLLVCYTARRIAHKRGIRCSNSVCLNVIFVICDLSDWKQELSYRKQIARQLHKH